MNILITEPTDYSHVALATYKKLGRVFLLLEVKKGEQKKIFAGTDIVVVRLGIQFDKKMLDAMPNLKIIATPTTGLNHIDMTEVGKRQIKIISLRGHTSFLKDVPSTAEETMALLFALARNIPWAFDDVKNGKWDRDAWKGHQLIHKTFGFWGCGRLGKIVAKYARAFGMEVIGYDPHVDASTMKRYGIKKVALQALLKRSDIISLHVLLTDKTHNIITKDHFKDMKSSALFINTARAEIVEKGALLAALKNKWIAGAGVDVMWDEFADGRHLKNNPLLTYAKKNKNLIIVPHVGGATYEAMHVTEEFIADLVQKSVEL